MITYLCKYTPLELIAALGGELEDPNTDVEDFRNADAMIHSSVCTHAKMLIESVLAAPPGGDGKLVLTNCCDSVRRVYDTLDTERRPGMEMLDLPHNASPASVKRYTGELMRLKDKVSSGEGFRRDVLISLWKENADRWKATLSQGPCVVIAGARVSDQLRTKIRDLLPYPVIDLTCGGLRSIPEPPPEAFIDVPDRPADCAAEGRGKAAATACGGSAGSSCGDSTGTAGGSSAGPACGCHGRTGLSDEALIRAYAKALLSQVPCTRMEDVSARDGLFARGEIVGVVYHSVKFCDYYSFEYADIRRKTDLPVLKIESDFTSQSEGQLDTRIRAFAESLADAVPSPAGEAGQNGVSGRRTGSAAGPGDAAGTEQRSGAAGAHDGRSKEPGGGPDKNGGKPMKGIYIGIDSGSTSTNAAALDENGRLAAWSIVRTGARAGTSAQNALDEVKKQLGEDAASIRRIVATGYGREFISFADSTKTEISCHARGAHFVDPAARTVIDIGGQDSKVICLDAEGNVRNFVMNDKCAAGTGRFLETMARTLELGMDEMSERGLRWKKDLTISSTCTVFAESEVVGLIAENTETGDIIHALNKSVAARTCGMVKRVRGEGPYMMTGGVARNAGVSKEIEGRLGASLSISEHPDLIGAIGAALFAMTP